MANANLTLTLTSSDLTSDTISLTILNTLAGATQGGIMRQKIEPTVIGSGQIIADEDLYTKGARVWLYNPSTATSNEKIYISVDSTTDQIILSGGDWAVIPWAASDSGTPVSLEAYAETANNILEYGIFQ
tara:strand:- start:3419 stop:3808 length:390 start_codon:yes stop_codon:yes gene_type:complete